jgi:hypothetical protein
MGREVDTCEEAQEGPGGACGGGGGGGGGGGCCHVTQGTASSATIVLTPLQKLGTKMQRPDPLSTCTAGDGAVVITGVTRCPLSRNFYYPNEQAQEVAKPFNINNEHTYA